MDYKLMKVAEETQKITQLGCYEIDNNNIKLIKKNNKSFATVQAFSPNDSSKFYYEYSQPKIREEKENMAKILVVDSDSFDAARDMENPLVMNFASATHKGGGFLTGAHAQEESLCRCSTLYASLTSVEAQAYYDYNMSLKSPMYSDYLLLSPNVCVFRDAELRLLKNPYNVAVGTIPAPNLRSIGHNVDKNELTRIMLWRIRHYLAVAVKYGYRNLVLGAWGCGAFRHDANDVAGYFYKVLVDEGFAALFDEIKFAIIKSAYNLQAFENVFANNANNKYVDYSKLRKMENREIIEHLQAIEVIVDQKCGRCENVYSCLGCNFAEFKQDIKHAREMVMIKEY
jgi:uncharacterized protein (TIGR02452 family)